MAEVPEVEFARASGSSIAYQVFGTGPVTICAVPPMAQNIEVAWDAPRIRYMLEGYGSFSRYLAFDKRGTGMSDRSLDIPALDERVDELRAVMDAAEIDHAFVHGLSEGGPMAIMFAATYPERVDGLILEGTGASLLSDEQRAAGRTGEAYAAQHQRWSEFADRWGTPESVTLAMFAPSLLADHDLAAWWPRYERQAANRDALMSLLQMNGQMDARGVLHRVDAPVLIVHRSGDRIVPIERARETYRLLDEAGADVRLVELDGDDHYSFAGDVDAIIAEVERFTTGAVRERPSRRPRHVQVTTMARFEVVVDREPVPTSAWGSKRARTLLKRLIAARGWPVTRDELMELLWPGEDSDRLGARLSVQLSAVRRILGGGVIADRSSVRLDLEAVDIDVERWFADDAPDAVVAGYRGVFLPDDRYDDWSGPLRDEMRTRFVTAARHEADVRSGDEAIALLRRVLAEDGYDETSHLALVAAYVSDGRLGEARAAHDAYVAAMAELGVTAAAWESVSSS